MLKNDSTQVQDSLLVNSRAGTHFRWFITMVIAFGMVAAPSPANALPATHLSAKTIMRAVDKPDTPSAPLDTSLVAEPFNAWTAGSGYLYWLSNCSVGPKSVIHGSSAVQPQSIESDGYLKRRSINMHHYPSGGIAIALATFPSSPCQNPNYLYLAADQTGLYYYNAIKSTLEVRTITKSDTPTTLTTLDVSAAPAIGLVLSGGYIYWIGHDSIIYFLPETGGTPGALRLTENPSSMTVGQTSDGPFVYWSDSTGVWKTKNCFTLGCASERLSTTPGKSLIYAPMRRNQSSTFDYSVFWVSGQSVIGYVCNTVFPPSCATDSVYTAPTTDNWKLGGLASIGKSVYWVENFDVCTSGQLCLPSTFGHLRRFTLGGTTDTITENLDLYSDVVADGTYVYYGGQHLGSGSSKYDLYQTPFDSAAIVHDVAFSNWEVTQEIQNIANDVPLVAHKPTYVRVYAQQLAGTNTNNLEAVLGGQRNGANLPGSPLQPINGLLSIFVGKSTDRAKLNDGWLFQLPDSWVEPGTTDLKVQIDPRGIYNDPTPNDNTAAASFNFVAKAPVCLVTVPVRTNAPAASNQDPSIFAMADVTKRLLPVSDVWLYHQDNDVAKLVGGFIPPWSYDAYRIPEDGNDVLHSLGFRDSFSYDQDACDNANAITHYVGILNPNSPTNAGGGGENLGLGERPGDTFYAKLIQPSLLGTSPDWFVQRFDTIAHELSHNYNRLHVNCPAGSPANPDPSYPYPPCQIDNIGQAAHYGFDINTLTPISPTLAADYMSYNSSFWVSDYTFKAMFGQFQSERQTQSNVATASPLSNRQATATDLTSSASVVYVTGLITPSTNSGSLNYAFAYPTATLSARVLNKLQLLSGRRFTGEANPVGVAAGSYHLRLSGAGGVQIDDHVITLKQVDDAVSDASYYLLSFPEPSTPVTRLDLMRDNVVLSSLQPGLQTPALGIVQPAGGETVDTHMTIVWQAGDADTADSLLYSVQYSPDAGKTWRAIASDFPGPAATGRVTLTLSSLNGFPGSGSNQALIRVAASDGYNTAIATSKPFTMKAHPPEPYIVPLGNQLPAGQAVPLNGGATDPQGGGLSGTALQWLVDGVQAGAGQHQRVDGLAPGTHRVNLVATSPANQHGTTAATFNMDLLHVPLVSESPVMDGNCDDPAYSSASQLRLSPYQDATQGVVRLVRTGADLWVCFGNLQQSNGGGLAKLFVDTKTADGLLSVAIAPDGSLTTNAKASGIADNVSDTVATWSAELRIPAVAVGGWDHVVSLSTEHLETFTSPSNVVESHRWPYASDVSQSSTWALTLLGNWKSRIALPFVER